MSELVADWLRTRSRNRPFFLFLNIMDAHGGYKVRDVNPFLPQDVSAQVARAVSQNPADYICRKDTSDPDLATLRALYRGGVQAADAKLGRVLARLDGHPITIVLSDHGEMLGEHRLFGHDIGLADVLLHVPLVVAELPHVAPAVIETPVELIDVLPSVLSWAHADVPASLPGRPLPTREPDPTGPRTLASEYMDHTTDERLPAWVRDAIRSARGACGPEDRVFGDMRAVIRFPYKLLWYAAYPPELFDIETDPAEAHDLSHDAPERVAALQAELETTTVGGPSHQGPPATIDPSVVERMRALGYLGGAPPRR